MRKIGITGGIGTGKTTVANILRKIGVDVVDVDLLSKKIAEEDRKCLKELINFFGSSIIDQNDNLKREELRKKAFENSEMLLSLNNIFQKYIAEKLYEKISEYEKEKKHIIAIDSAIPFEKGFIDVVDEIWVVLSNREERIKRAQRKMNISRNEVLKIINLQKSDKEYLEIADKVLYNNKSINALENIVLKLI